jgi:hypothetical protein
MPATTHITTRLCLSGFASPEDGETFGANRGAIAVVAFLVYRGRRAGAGRAGLQAEDHRTREKNMQVWFAFGVAALVGLLWTSFGPAGD